MMCVPECDDTYRSVVILFFYLYLHNLLHLHTNYIFACRMLLARWVLARLTNINASLSRRF